MQSDPCHDVDALPVATFGLQESTPKLIQNDPKSTHKPEQRGNGKREREEALACFLLTPVCSGLRLEPIFDKLETFFNLLPASWEHLEALMDLTWKPSWISHHLGRGNKRKQVRALDIAGRAGHVGSLGVFRHLDRGNKKK